MDAQEIALKLDGTQYPNRELEDRIATHIEEILEGDFIIAYPQSDDLIEFRGQYDDESGWQTYLTADGEIYYPECSDDRCPHEEGLKLFMKQVICTDDRHEINGFEVQLLHSDVDGVGHIQCPTFRILEDDEVYGTGIVIHTDQLKKDFNP